MSVTLRSCASSASRRARQLACILETCVFAVVGVVVGSILYAVTLPAWELRCPSRAADGEPVRWVGVVALLVEARRGVS